MKKNRFQILFLIAFLIFTIGFSFHFLNGANHLDKNENVRDSSKLKTNDVYYEATNGSALGVFVSGDFAYVADSIGGLKIINISDPTNPGTPVYVGLNDSAYDVFVWGNYAYVGVWQEGLAVINVSDPTNPGDPVYRDTPGRGRGVRVTGDFAYVADWGQGLAVIDITDPTNPGAPINKDTSGGAYRVYVEGNFAYIATGTGGLAVIDISNPTQPGDPIYHPLTVSAEDVFVSGNYAYVADANTGLAIINISDPTVPGPHVYSSLTGNPKCVYVSGDFAYVGLEDNMMAVINISDPTSPGAPVYMPLSDPARGIFVSGNFAYVACLSSGLAVIKIGELIDPTFLASGSTADDPNGVFVSGDYLYVADEQDGLSVMDISEPSNPVWKTSRGVGGSQWAVEIFVDGDYAFLAVQPSGLVIIDISDPLNPGAPIFANTTGSPWDVHVAGNFAYVADDFGMLAVINITDPTNPGAPDYWDPIFGNIVGVDVDGDFAFTARGGFGLDIVDITDPTSPSLITTADTFDSAMGVVVAGDYAYVADSSGLAVIDISDPYNAAQIAYRNVNGDARYIDISGDRIYMGCLAGGLAVIDISDPTNPGTPAYWNPAYLIEDVFVDGDHVYAAGDSPPGIAVIKVMTPWYALTAPTLDPIVPNPDYDGMIHLDWTGIAGATTYYIYRDTKDIKILTGLTPIDTTTTSDYIDYIMTDDQYYYAVAAGNSRGMSWISNSAVVNVSLTFLSLGSYGEKQFIVNDTFLLTPRPLMANKWYGFYLGCTGSYDYNVVIQKDGVDYHSSTLGTGQDDYVLWYTGSTNNYSAVITYASGANTTYQYHFMNITSKGLMPAYDFRSFAGNGEMLQVNVPSSGTYYIQLVNSSGIRVKLYGPAFPTGDERDASYVPQEELYAATDALYASHFGLGASGQYTMLITREDNLTSLRNYTIQFSDDPWTPTSFTLESPTDWVTNQTPPVICQFSEVGSGVDISNVEYAYSTNGDPAPTNWTPVDGVFKDPACTIPAQDYDTGDLYAKVNAVPFNQDSDVNNTIRFRARDMIMSTGTQATAFTIKTDSQAPAFFSVYSPTDWVYNNQTPTVKATMYFYPSAIDSGVNLSSVEYAYSTDGNLTWSSWLPVEGVYNDSACTEPSTNGTTGWVYVKVDAVPFNQDSAVNNTIRFRARDMAGNFGTQANADIIKIDTIYSINQTEYGMNQLTCGNDTYVLNPQPLPTGQYYGFYMDCTGSYNYDLMIRRNNTDWVLSQRADGEDDWVIWYPANNYTYVADVRYVSGPIETYQYTFLNTSSISTNETWQSRSFEGKGELLEVSLVSTTYYTLRLTNAANIKIRLYGPSTAGFARTASGPPALAGLDAPDNGGYATTFSVGTTGTYVLLVYLDNNDFNANYTLYFNHDVAAPSLFSIESPTDWVVNQTPTVIGKFVEGLGSGIDISTVEYAYATDGNLTPENWKPVDGVFLDSACTIPVSDYDYGWFYAKVDAVLFNQDSAVNNTIRFRARDMEGNLGTQSTANVIKVDSTSPSFSLHAPTNWTNNETPTVICQIYLAPLSGINSSTVEFAYATDGNLSPTNWALVEGIYNDAACTSPVGDNETGFIYARVIGVPFNQEHETNNVIRFRAATMAGRLGNSSSFIIKIDSSSPWMFGLNPVSTVWLANQTPEVHLYFVLSMSGLNSSSVEYSYSTDGNLTWSGWAPVDGVWNESDYSNVAEDGETGLLFTMVNMVPFGQDSDVNNTIRIRVRDMAGNLGVSENFTIRIDTGAPYLFVQDPNGTYFNFPPLMDVDFSDSYSLDSAYYKVDSFSPTGNATTGWTPIFVNLAFVSAYGNDFVMDASVWGNLSDGSHTVYFKVWDDAGNVNDGATPAWQFYKDTTKPNVTEVEILPANPKPGDTINISLTINDSAGVQFAIIYYDKGEGWQSPVMLPIGGKYKIQISTDPDTFQIKYYVIINDTLGNQESYGSISDPFVISLSSDEGGNWMIYVLIIAAVAAVAVTLIALKRRRPSPQVEVPTKLVPPKTIGKTDLEGIIDHLRAKEITIEAIPTLQDAELDQLLKESLQSLSAEDIKLLQTDEFSELSKEEKEEMLKDMVLLSKTEKQDIAAKLKDLSKELEQD